MATRGAIDIAFDRDLSKAYTMYENDELDSCEALLRDMNNDSAIPRYHRIKTLALLASIVEPWVDANNFRLTAETLWTMVRNYHPEGKDPVIDRSLAELRGELDDLRTALAPDIEPETDEERAARLDDEFIATAGGEDEHLTFDDDDKIALNEADSEALGMPVDKMEQLTLSKAAPKLEGPEVQPPPFQTASKPPQAMRNPALNRNNATETMDPVAADEANKNIKKDKDDKQKAKDDKKKADKKAGKKVEKNAAKKRG